LLANELVQLGSMFEAAKRNLKGSFHGT
jgi:hypothetical protein